MVGSYVPFTFFSLKTRSKKRIQRSSKGRLVFWFKTHRDICCSGDKNHKRIASKKKFPCWNPLCLSLSDSCYFVSRPQSDANPQSQRQQAAACHLFFLPFFFFFFKIASISPRSWFIRERELVIWHIRRYIECQAEQMLPCLWVCDM